LAQAETKVQMEVLQTFQVLVPKLLLLITTAEGVDVVQEQEVL
jgi:hypothetical protein